MSRGKVKFTPRQQRANRNGGVASQFSTREASVGFGDRSEAHHGAELRCDPRHRREPRSSLFLPDGLRVQTPLSLLAPMHAEGGRRHLDETPAAFLVGQVLDLAHELPRFRPHFLSAVSLFRGVETSPTGLPSRNPPLSALPACRPHPNPDLGTPTPLPLASPDSRASTGGFDTRRQLLEHCAPEVHSQLRSVDPLTRMITHTHTLGRGQGPTRLGGTRPGRLSRAPRISRTRSRRTEQNAER